MRDELRSGELRAILQPAQAYLGQFWELPNEAPPGERLATWIGPDLRDDALHGFETTLWRPDLPSPAAIAEFLARDTIYNYGFPIMAGMYERMRNGKGIADLPASLKQTALLLSYEDHGWNLDGERDGLRAALEAEIASTPEARLAFARLWIEPALATGKERIAATYTLAHDPDWRLTGSTLAAGWLAAFPQLSESVEADLIACLIDGGGLTTLSAVAELREATVFRDLRHMLLWTAVDVVARFETVRPHLSSISTNCPDFIWFLRDRVQFEKRGGMVPLTVAQAEWIVAEFRGQWPDATLAGVGTGNTNDYDAADFLRGLMNRIASDAGLEAGEAMTRLVAGPVDSYTELMRHMAAEQRQKRAEENFTALAPASLAGLLDDGPPGNIEDLKALVLEEMAVIQRKLIGDDLDSIADFWTDDGIPRGENRCRDRLAAMIGPELARYGIDRITEADMPQTNRADLAFARAQMQFPVEIKGQWHDEVWDAATGQLDARYLIDWRSEQRGIYCVLWFGNLPSSSNRRLQAHPNGLAPQSAEQMRVMLIDRVPEARRAVIDVVVLDLTAAKS